MTIFLYVCRIKGCSSLHSQPASRLTHIDWLVGRNELFAHNITTGT